MYEPDPTSPSVYFMGEVIGAISAALILGIIVGNALHWVCQ